jgi:endonuclease/exonuclease/phosphatase family metal-dependent hydrolase
MRVAGAGADVWGVADALRYTYVPMTGDGSIVSQVTTVEPLNAWTKAGVMMRESLAPNARHAFMLVSPGKGLAFQRRVTTGGDSTNTSGGSGTAPAWVKLTREGSVFSAFRSADGANWTLVGTDSIAMGSTIYVGVAVSSHVAGTLAAANFTGTVLSPLTLTVSDPVGLQPVVTDTLRLLHWNTHHGGIGTDGVYDPARLAGWIAQMSPDIASLNEVDTTAQVDAIVSALAAKTGVQWYVSYSGLGNVVISRLAPTATSRCVYPDGTRYSAHLATVINGRPINVWSIHTTVDNADSRLAEVKGLQTCSLSWPEARILAGDYNMQQGSPEYNQAMVGHTDAWLVAKALGTAVNFAGNCDGCTRNSRIDYVFTSTGATFLALKSARIVDTRDASGYTPSDHKPMLVEYDVK